MATSPSNGPSAKIGWAGRIISGLIIGLLGLDAFGKLAELQPVIEGTVRLGYPAHLVFALGAIELACVVAYLVPPAAIVGAILLTGYLGGAVATHVRVEDPLWTHTFAPIYMGVLVWVSLALRDPRLRWTVRSPRAAAKASALSPEP